MRALNGRRRLIAVAHGSAHPEAAATVAALARQVRRLAPVIDVRIAFMQDGEPSLAQALAEAGEDAVIVPLLLSTGYHLTTDIAAVVRAGTAGPDAAEAGLLDQGAAATTAGGAIAGQGRLGAGDAGQDAGGPGTASAVTAWTGGSGLGGGRTWLVTGPLGPDYLLVTALARRLVEAGVPDGTPIVLAAAGSADPEAARQIGAQAELLAGALAVPVTVGFAAAGTPSVPDAVADLRARTGAQVAVASYLLAQGHFHDRLAAAGADWVTRPLGDHPAVAALVIERYRTAA